MIIKYQQLPFSFDVHQLKEEVMLLDSNNWISHYQKLHYHGNWTALPLRSIDGSSDNIMVQPTNNYNYADTIFLKQSPYLQHTLNTFKCSILGARLLKLESGAEIKEHRDADLNFEKGEIRLHIPVITHEDVEFYLDNEKIIMLEGQCWYMNLNLPHRIKNKSQVNRIHLVIDALVNEWVKEVFETDTPLPKKQLEASEQSSAETRNHMIRMLREMNTPTSNQLADKISATLT